MARRRWPGWFGRLAWVLCLGAEAIAVACVVLLLAGHVSFEDAVNAYLVTNLGMVVTFAAIGGLVAGNRPGNPIGWLFLGHSACFAVATLAGTIAVVQQANLSLGDLQGLMVVFMGLWPLGIGIALPLAVQLFPTGRPLSPTWSMSSAGDRLLRHLSGRAVADRRARLGSGRVAVEWR